MEDIIKCKICGAIFKQIHHRHLKQHGITVDQYKEQFPEAPINSQSSSQRRSTSLKGREIHWAHKISESNKQSWVKNPNQGRTGCPLSEESRKAVSRKLMGHFVSEETRRLIGQAGLGREPWNKWQTKETDGRLISVAEKVKAWNKQCMTDERRKQISQSLKQRYLDGMEIPHAKGGFRADLQQYFRSTWEANFARIMNLNSVQWKYESKKYPLYDKTGSLLFVYTPDFYTDHLIEIKGHAESQDEWTCECSRCIRDKLKMTLFFDQYPDMKIEIIARKEYKLLSQQYKRLVDGWENTSRG